MLDHDNQKITYHLLERALECCHMPLRCPLSVPEDADAYRRARLKPDTVCSPVGGARLNLEEQLPREVVGWS